MITHNPRKTSPIAGVVSSTTAVASDLIELTELQFELAKVDCKNVLNQIYPALVGTLIGSTFFLASLPVFLLGIAHCVSDYFHWSLWSSMLVVAGAVCILGAGALMIFVNKLKLSLRGFSNSIEQLQKNIYWLKSTLRGD